MVLCSLCQPGCSSLHCSYCISRVQEMRIVHRILTEISFYLIFHGNDFSEIQWGCKSLFHGQSHQRLSSDWLMPPCPSLFLSFPADELLPDSRKSFLVPKYTALHFVQLIETVLNLAQPLQHPFQILCSLSVLAVLLYFLSLIDVSLSYSKVFNKNIK